VTSSSSKSSQPVRPRRPSAVPSSVLKSMDNTERYVGFGVSIIGLFLSLVTLYQAAIIKKASQVTTASPVHGKCASGYHLVKKACEHVTIITAGGLWMEFGLIALSVLAFFLCVFFRRRYLTAFLGFWAGLVLGLFSSGLPFFLYAVWLGWRAWRLQKYGDATFAGVSRITRERALARKEGRPEPELPNYAEVEEPKTSRPTSKSSATTTPPKKQAEPSKRYTPKKQTGKRR